MSRCFPYPPPEYLREGACGDAVKESIKLRREEKNTVTEHKKEKNRGRDHRKRDDKKGNKDEFHSRWDKWEHMEKNISSLSKLPSEEEAEGSGLTEEHGQPVSPGSLCYLSDCTRANSKKRKVDHSDSASTVTRTHGNVFRIRLPLRKPAQPDGGEHVCSTSHRDGSLPQQSEIRCLPSEEQCCPSPSKSGPSGTEHMPTSVKASSRTDSQRKEESALPPSVTKKSEKKRPTVESMYKALIEDWVPAPLQLELGDSDDQDWLFGTAKAKQGVQGNKSCKSSHGALSTSNSWPRACYLPEADIYALPYTIPF